jgi:hypothetical protein
MTEPVSESTWARPCRALRPYVDGYRGYRLQVQIGEPVAGVHRESASADVARADTF